MEYTTSIEKLPGVGKTYAKRLKKLDIYTIYDLLHHYPVRYKDYTTLTPIAHAQPPQTVTIHARIVSGENSITKTGKKIQKIWIADDTSQMLIVFFNQPFLIYNFKKNSNIAVSGEITFFGREKAMISPDFEILFNREPIHTGRIVPVYHETKGISSKWLRSKIALSFKKITMPKDYLPNTLLKKQHLLPLTTALYQIHFPKDMKEVQKARERLAFDELFLKMLSSNIRKKAWKKEKTTYCIPIHSYQKDISAFIQSLPFRLTGAQKRAVDEILNDLNKEKPMNRLLQGDVGSGKTVVAAIAIYAVYKAKLKTILMAPTEILARQHYQTIVEYFKQHPIKIALVTSDTSKKFTAEKLKNYDVIIGTHALLYKTSYVNTALVVIDEQQRFGVEQRAKLKKLGLYPHLLSMTATPIPRSYALILYSELDVSYIDEMPQGRKMVKTYLVPNYKREKAYNWIENHIKKTKSQAFIICPLIEESSHETLQSVKSAKKEYEYLSKKIFPHLKLGLLHGKTKQKEKQAILSRMAQGKLDILVATPLVEVGIDIPKASIVVIEAADRFGLAQLHQLRGRVGRNNQQAYCFLFTENENEKTKKRLHYLASISSGAVLAEIDMKIRGHGDIYGIRQSGFADFKLASLSDTALYTKVRNSISYIFSTDPSFGLSSKTSKQFTRLHERIQDYIIQDIAND